MGNAPRGREPEPRTRAPPGGIPPFLKSGALVISRPSAAPLKAPASIPSLRGGAAKSTKERATYGP